MLEDAYYQDLGKLEKSEETFENQFVISNKNLDTCRTHEVFKHDIEYVIAMLENLGEGIKTGAMKMKLK